MRNNRSTPPLKHARIFLSVLVMAILSACSTSTPSAAPLPVTTQAASPEIPSTGLSLPAGAPAPQAGPAALSSTRSPVPQATLVPVTATPPAAPDCQSPAALTPAQTEGPYFKAGSPERTSLIETGTAGAKLVLTGYVLTRDCQPVAHALLDFWQADASGQYDNSGYTLRGHQFTDAQGRYQLVTVVPGLYTGRTEHIHVKVQAPNGPVLTSQLYFPDVPSNQRDGIFDPALLVSVVSKGNPEQASFNFVIQAP